MDAIKFLQDVIVREDGSTEAMPKNITEPKAGDAGYDLSCLGDVTINGRDMVAINTGAFIAIPEGHVGLILDRSSIAKEKLVTAGGVIDSSYRGEVKVVMFNLNQSARSFKDGERIAQLVILPCITPPLKQVKDLIELGDTERGAKGFGSTNRQSFANRFKKEIKSPDLEKELAKEE